MLTTQAQQYCYLSLLSLKTLISCRILPIDTCWWQWVKFKEKSRVQWLLLLSVLNLLTSLKSNKNTYTKETLLPSRQKTWSVSIQACLQYGSDMLWEYLAYAHALYLHTSSSNLPAIVYNFPLRFNSNLRASFLRGQEKYCHENPSRERPE